MRAEETDKHPSCLEGTTRSRANAVGTIGVYLAAGLIGAVIAFVRARILGQERRRPFCFLVGIRKGIDRRGRQSKASIVRRL